MAILVDRETRLLVQGLTGSEGRFHGLRNRAYGTNVVAGVTPGKGGQDVDGIPVFDTVADAVAETGANTRLVFVPARVRRRRGVRGGDAGIGTSSASPSTSRSTTCSGCTRTCSARRDADRAELPGRALAGQGERRDHPGGGLPPGRVGLVSRSGTLTYQIGYELAQLGLGNSTIVGIGGDPIVGSTFVDVLRALRGRPRDRDRGARRRDRRRRGGEGRALRRGADVEARVRVHRAASRRLPGRRWGTPGRSSPARRAPRRRRRRRSRPPASPSARRRPKSRSSSRALLRYDWTRRGR